MCKGRSKRNMIRGKFTLLPFLEDWDRLQCSSLDTFDYFPFISPVDFPSSSVLDGSCKQVCASFQKYPWIEFRQRFITFQVKQCIKIA